MSLDETDQVLRAFVYRKQVNDVVRKSACYNSVKEGQLADPLNGRTNLHHGGLVVKCLCVLELEQ